MMIMITRLARGNQPDYRRFSKIIYRDITNHQTIISRIMFCFSCALSDSSSPIVVNQHRRSSRFIFVSDVSSLHALTTPMPFPLFADFRQLRRSRRHEPYVYDAPRLFLRACLRHDARRAARMPRSACRYFCRRLPCGARHAACAFSLSLRGCALIHVTSAARALRA